jgi:hypothetical protein
LLLFRLSVKIHVPISINIILQTLWLMYTSVCYTLFKLQQTRRCSSGVSLL